MAREHIKKLYKVSSFYVFVQVHSVHTNYANLINYLSGRVQADRNVDVMRGQKPAGYPSMSATNFLKSRPDDNAMLLQQNH